MLFWVSNVFKSVLISKCILGLLSKTFLTTFELGDVFIILFQKCVFYISF
jgi:hypothetical protein